jgi:hypothetical protein
MFSDILISSSAPAAQNAKEAGGILALAASSSASKSTESTSFPPATFGGRTLARSAIDRQGPS